jgi:hypothetical protein
MHLRRSAIGLGENVASPRRDDLTEVTESELRGGQNNGPPNKILAYFYT